LVPPPLASESYHQCSVGTSWIAPA